MYFCSNVTGEGIANIRKEHSGKDSNYVLFSIYNKTNCKIIDIQNKISNKKNSEYNDTILRTGDKSMVCFNLNIDPNLLVLVPEYF
jgi:hypothetical protein